MRFPKNTVPILHEKKIIERRGIGRIDAVLVLPMGLESGTQSREASVIFCRRISAPLK